MIRKNMLTAVAAWAAIAATGAHAQSITKSAAHQPCLSDEQAGAVVMVMAPGAFRGLNRICSKLLPSNAYMLTSGKALTAKFDVLAERSGDLADRAMARMVDADDDDIVPGASASLRPMGEMLIASEAKKMTPETCGKVDRALKLLDPLPPENLVGLVVLLMELGMAAEKDPPFTICKPSR
ncbi:hypothetical protein TPR58_11385 [Sphingomonas sp. HF-S3]|uniref:Uncharacterized protein n=1 Tax=Sphingomonas rustica TaxID=3103142 RepID=A0ABV0B9A4_9SPHN